jgi:hypothetical protein
MNQARQIAEHRFAISLGRRPSRRAIPNWPGPFVPRARQAAILARARVPMRTDLSNMRPFAAPSREGRNSAPA